MKGQKTYITTNLGVSPNGTKIRHMQPYFTRSSSTLSKDKPLTTVDTIVLHWTGGSTISSAIDTLWKGDASYHFIIEKDGLVTQTKPISEQANHAGCSYGPNGTYVNTTSIGISFVTVGGWLQDNLITDNQINAMVNLVADINLAIKGETGGSGIKWITTHFQISPVRKEDPVSLEPHMEASGPNTAIASKNIIQLIRNKTGNKNIRYWKQGMGPTWPKGLKEGCKCIEGVKDIKGMSNTIPIEGGTDDDKVAWCKKTKGRCHFKKTTTNCCDKYIYNWDMVNLFIKKEMKQELPNDSVFHKNDNNNSC